MRILYGPLEFEWDKGNRDKNYVKHHVTDGEAEQVFIDQNRFIFKDKLHSANEERFRILGRTKNKRLLFIVFTIRNKKIRIISARDINRKEEGFYEKKIKTSKV